MQTALCTTRHHRSDDPLRYGCTLAHPEGYDLIPDVVEVAKTMLKPPVVASVRSPAWKKPSRRRYRLSEVLGTLQSDGRAYELLRANDHEGLKALEKQCLDRTHSTKTGIVPKR